MAFVSRYTRTHVYDLISFEQLLIDDEKPLPWLPIRF